MTPEQLDEIEALAAEATPDPWCVAIRGSEVTIETAGVECFVVAEMPRSGATDVQDATFIRAMREHALPLVKALREARVERDAALKEAETQGAMHHRYYWSLMACDEARAFDKDDHKKVVVTLTKERDEARAEVERLRAALGVTL